MHSPYLQGAIDDKLPLSLIGVPVHLPQRPGLKVHQRATHLGGGCEVLLICSAHYASVCVYLQSDLLQYAV